MQNYGERYDKSKHGSQVWLDYSEANPPKRGYYTVICNVRNHLWVRDNYHYNGSYWITPAHTVTDAGVKYAPASRMSDGGFEV